VHVDLKGTIVGGQAWFSGDILSSDSTPIGRITRKFFLDKGELVVRNAWLVITDTNFRGKGLSVIT
jgi:hypothetical protein